MGKRGQIAMEYLILAGIIMLFLIPLITIFSTNTRSLSDSVMSHHTAGVANQITKTAQAVHALGPPSKTTLKVYFPPGIANITVGPKELVFVLKRSNGLDEVLSHSPINISGNLNNSQGQKSVLIEAREGYVWIFG